MLGWCFVPVYMASEVYTMPEYMRKRFGGQRIRVYLAAVTLLLYVFTKISADLYSGALFITEAFQYNDEGAIYIAILLLLAIAGIFTVFGGLTSIIWTDMLQTFLMIIGAVTVCVTAIIRVGGYTQLLEKYSKSLAKNRSLIRDPNLIVSDFASRFHGF